MSECVFVGKMIYDLLKYILMIYVQLNLITLLSWHYDMVLFMFKSHYDFISSVEHIRIYFEENYI